MTPNSPLLLAALREGGTTPETWGIIRRWACPDLPHCRERGPRVTVRKAVPGGPPVRSRVWGVVATRVFILGLGRVPRRTPLIWELACKRAAARLESGEITEPRRRIL